MSKSYLIDTTNCVGCRACQTACKQWKDMPGEQTVLNPTTRNFQNPTTLSSKTLTVVQFHELEDDKAPGGLRTVFAKRQCMHCEEPACASACPVTAIHKTGEGAVAYDASKCIGCRYCMWACPWGVPMAEWDSLAPKISKCDMCHERFQFEAPAEFNGQALSAEDAKQLAAMNSLPACVKTCPAGALKFGEREELLKEAKERIRQSPGKYVDHVYGEHEAGGTNVLYLASVPFTKLGFPEVGTEPYPKYSKVALGAVPPAVIGVGAVLGGAYALQKRKAEVAKEALAAKPAAAAAEAHDHHPHFERLDKKLWTPANLLLAALMAFGGVSFLARFALGLGGATHLSDTYAWGLWIVFDLVWIAVAAGAFATAGLIYVAQRKDLYSIGRSAVLMGLLSYSFVTVTLLADLGLPWHFYQLGLQAPEHSAMFEVSWCVGLYVTILLLEFLPVPFERWGLAKAAETWRKYAPVYVVGALSVFVYLLSRKVIWSALALVVFGFLAWTFRQPKGKKPEPIMLAIAAVTFSTMHQSSLGSLMLLMPDKLNHLWWSPVIPVLFFLSSIAAGLGLVILVEMWIAKAWNRTLRVKQLAAMGQVTFWALLVYLVARFADVAVRGELAGVGANPKGALFLVEVVVGGLLPLALLSQKSLREKPGVLGLAAFLTTGGIVLNRMSVVLFAMTLKGPMPQIAAASYSPSVFEWGISVGLIAATIFLFGLGARLMPVLPAEEKSH
ncbi:4Fe-4S dicluster domain-containing protein [Anaeromyxobacter paludicola]|uniref:4Fe-4S ferredoxin-type domain-containing protein n=1 Tax=Anaeromyxobacter paludicola TaxID=2918171 RepID=A0ABN6N8I3_9BACT|nr:4Fe-4S dicluster domain-containing protein [Anaeromyxobacter paludicola]BDG08508.1 hypothetical protein AMPC_16210 [Anaeromyxobacter paludicola]